MGHSIHTVVPLCQHPSYAAVSGEHALRDNEWTSSSIGMSILGGACQIHMTSLAA